MTGRREERDLGQAVWEGMTREPGIAAQQNVTPFGSQRPDRGDVGLLKGSCKVGGDWRQVEYSTLQMKESLQIPFATYYAEEGIGFFLRQSNPEIPMPLGSVRTLWSSLGSCRAGGPY